MVTLALKSGGAIAIQEASSGALFEKCAIVYEDKTIAYMRDVISYTVCRPTWPSRSERDYFLTMP